MRFEAPSRAPGVGDLLRLQIREPMARWKAGDEDGIMARPDGGGHEHLGHTGPVARREAQWRPEGEVDGCSDPPADGHASEHIDR